MTFAIILSSAAAAASYSYSQLSNIITPGIKITSPLNGQQIQLVRFQSMEHQQIMLLLIVRFMLIGTIQSHFKKL